MTGSSLFSLESKLLDNLVKLNVTTNLVVAFSGGIDSKVLLHTLVRLRDQNYIHQLSALHVNHGLQKASDDWQKECQSVCDIYQVNLLTKKLALTGKIKSNIELVAREQRYQFFQETLTKEQSLVMAHHQDDQAETLLFRLLRGAGLSGVSSIPEKRVLGEGQLLRPLLDVTRAEIEDYAHQQKLSWVEDPSNQEQGFSRNFLRHKILPKIKEKWPSYTKTLGRFAQLAREQTELLELLAEEDLQKICEQGQKISVAKLAQLSIARKKNVLHFWGKEQTSFPPSSKEIESLLAQLKAAESKSIQVSFAGQLIRSYAGDLMITRLVEPVPLQAKLLWQDIRQAISLPNGVRIITDTIQLNDNDKLRQPNKDEVVWVDARRGGEVCQPSYRQKSTQLKIIYQELGVPPWQREWLPIIYFNQSIAAVPGVFVSKDFMSSDGISLKIN